MQQKTSSREKLAHTKDQDYQEKSPEPSRRPVGIEQDGDQSDYNEHSQHAEAGHDESRDDIEMKIIHRSDPRSMARA